MSSPIRAPLNRTHHDYYAPPCLILLAVISCSKSVSVCRVDLYVWLVIVGLFMVFGQIGPIALSLFVNGTVHTLKIVVLMMNNIVGTFVERRYKEILLMQQKYSQNLSHRLPCHFYFVRLRACLEEDKSHHSPDLYCWPINTRFCQTSLAV